MKRVLAMLLVVMTLGGTVLSAGCSIVTRGSDYCYKFLDYIQEGDFDKAYEMIADSIKAPETEEERAARVKEETDAKAEQRRKWRRLFGLPEEEEKSVEAEGTPTPTAEPTPTPADEADPTATSTPTPEMRNGVTPDPETGEYPVVEETPAPTPDPNNDATALPAEPGTTPTPENGGPTPAPKRAQVTNSPTPEPGETPEPTPVPTDDAGEPIVDKTITKVGFVEKYQSIFDELQLTGMEYTTTDVTDGEIIAKVSYQQTYHSTRGGDLTYDFEITANRIEHRWTIEWSPNLIFPMMEWGDSLRVGTLQANRGEILCDSKAYAQNVNTITVFCVPSTIPDVEEFIRQVAAVPEMEMTEEAVRTALSKQRNDFAKLATFFPDEATLEFKKRILEIKGISIDTANYGTLRYYPFGKSLCHLIGYAGIISKKEKTNYEAYGDITYNSKEKRFETTGTTRYNGDSWIGKYGLELLYENQLLGTNGRFTYIQDPNGGSRGMLYKTDAVDGNDLHLTIRPELQERLESVIDTVVYDTSVHGTALVMNPKTGAILAMTSWPGFDLNYLARGMPEEEWAALENDPTIPLYNRATQGLYTPGSVFKPLTCAALLETNTMTVNDQFPASEEIYNDQWYPSEAFMASMADRTSQDSWKVQSVDHSLKRTRSDSRPAPMNMTNSVISSDNLYFAYCALRMGWKKYEDYFVNKLDWETPMSLEADNTQPRIYWKAGSDGISWQNVAEGGEPIWKQNENGVWEKQEKVNLVLDKMLYGMDMSTAQLYDHAKKQSDYDLAVTGYGQGQIMVSPLQMAYYISAYANGGTIMQPYVVDSIWHADGTNYELVEQRTPKVYKQLLQQATVDTLYPALEEVCGSVGTARWMAKSFITKSPLKLGYKMAAKTGTAEITDDKSKELAWLVCWRDKDEATGEPVSDEDARLICIMLEVTLPMKTEWSQMKFDIARAMLKKDVLNNDNMETAA